MNDNRNMILAIVLSALVLLGWSLLSDQLLPDRRRRRPQQVENGKVKPLPAAAGRPGRRRAAGHPQPRNVVLARNPAGADRDAEPRRARSTSRARGSTISCCVRQRETIAKNSPPVRLLSPAGAPGAYFADFGWAGEGVAAPDANTVWTASAPVLDPRQAGDAELDQRRPASASSRSSRSTTAICSPSSQRVANRGAGAVARAPLRPRQPRRPSRPTRRRWTDARRPDRLPRRHGQLRHRLGNARRGRAGGEPSTAAAAGSASPTNIG